MTHTHPRDERRTDSPARETETTQRVGRAEYRDDRTDRTAYEDDRDDMMTRREPARDEPVRGDIPTRKVRETKPAFLTTEFWFAAGGIAALVVIYLVEDDPSLDLFRTALLATLIGAAYIVSRGLAKAGSRTTRQPEDPRLAARHDLR
jgi:hypothetical protein